MGKLKWHLEITNLKDMEDGLFGGDYFLNTKVENFFTLDEVWSYIGGKLKKERCGYGYSGIRGIYSYTLTRIY